MTAYSVKNLGELAEAFEARAADARHAAKFINTQQERIGKEREAATWLEAAAILRNTKLGS